MSSKDKTLRSIFDELPLRLSHILSPAPITELLPTTLPSSELRLDFLAKLQNQTIFHMEFQFFNDPDMPWRMLRYYTSIAERYKTKNIKQLLVYVGNERLSMKDTLELENLTFRYDMLDIRQIDCRELLESQDPGDRIIACLCRVEDEEYLIRKLLETMEGMRDEERKDFMVKVLTLTELRPNLRVKLSEEVRHMPIVVRPEDIKLPESELRKDLLYSLGLEEGLHKGKQLGLEEGLHRGKQLGLEEGLLLDAQEMLLTVIEGRLGYVPEGVEGRVRKIKDRAYLHGLVRKVVSAQDVEGLLREELRID